MQCVECTVTPCDMLIVSCALPRDTVLQLGCANSCAPSLGTLACIHVVWYKRMRPGGPGETVQRRFYKMSPGALAGLRG